MNSLKRVKAPFFWLTFGLGGVFLFSVQIKILNYVCGNDPMLYIRAARTFLSPGLYGADAVREAVTFVAPGYPLILAVVIAIFGSLSPYWLNLGFLLLTLPFLYDLFQRLMGNGRAACFSVLSLFWLLMAGHRMHAPYLLYPFREASRVFFIVLCFWFFLKAADGERRWKIWGSLSSVSLILACGIREPSVFVLPALLLGVAFLPTANLPRKKLVAVFLIPWAFVLLAGLLFILLGPASDFSQFSVIRFLKNHETAFDRMDQMFPWFVERGGGWSGVILFCVGLGRALIRSRVLLLWWAGSGIVLFVFYAYMHMHTRYFMTSLILLLPFVGYGLDGVLRLIERLHPGKRLFGVTTSLVFVGSIYGMVRTIETREVWGPETSVEQVRQWQQRVKELPRAEDGRVHVATEQRCRYLEDILLSYTDVNLLDPKRTEDWSDAVFPATYYYPYNHATIYSEAQWIDHKEVFAHNLIRYVFSLVLSGGSNMFIGKGEYGEYTITPFSDKEQVQKLSLQPGVDHLLWFDWGYSDPKAVRDIVLHGQEPLASFQQHGRGIQAVFVPAAIGDSVSYLTVLPTASVPKEPVFLVQSSELPLGLSLTKDRRMSSNLLLPNRDDHDARPEYRVIRTYRDFSVQAPLLFQAPAGSEWIFTPELANFPAGYGWQLISKRGDEEETRQVNLFADQPLPSFTLSPGEELFIRLRNAKAPESNERLYVGAIKFTLKLPSSSP